MVVAAPAQAATVFSQGPIFPDTGVRSSFWNADDFTLSAASTLTGATVFLAEDIRFRTQYENAISYAVYSDANGAPGALLLTGIGTPVRDRRQRSLYRQRNAAVLFMGIRLRHPDRGAGRHALLGRRAAEQRSGARGAAGTNPGASAQLGGSVLGPYSPRGPGLAFSIQGTAVPVIGAVPEPASWAMMIVGFGLVGGVLRRRGSGITTRVSYAA